MRPLDEEALDLCAADLRILTMTGERPVAATRASMTREMLGEAVALTLRQPDGGD